MTEGSGYPCRPSLSQEAVEGVEAGLHLEALGWLCHQGPRDAPGKAGGSPPAWLHPPGLRSPPVARVRRSGPKKRAKRSGEAVLRASGSLASSVARPSSRGGMFGCEAEACVNIGELSGGGSVDPGLPDWMKTSYKLVAEQDLEQGRL